VGQSHIGFAIVLAACGGANNATDAGPNGDSTVQIPPGTNGNPNGHCGVPTAALATAGAARRLVPRSRSSASQ
jgi:hypothetical protein